MHRKDQLVHNDTDTEQN